MNLRSSLQTQYIGSRYSLLEFYLYKDTSGEDFYIDVVHIGKMATAVDENGTELDSTYCLIVQTVFKYLNILLKSKFFYFYPTVLQNTFKCITLMPVQGVLNTCFLPN